MEFLPSINTLRRVYLRFTRGNKIKNRGVTGRRGDTVDFYAQGNNFSATVDGHRVQHASYDDWKHLQILKGKPDWLAKNWALTQEKQEKHWAFAGVQKGTRLLEVGFRDGFNLRHLQEQGVLVEGIDVNGPAVEHAIKLGCRAYEEDIQQKTHFADGAFDIVSACDVLEHCFAPDAALREIHRVLIVGGKAVIEIPFEDEFTENLAHGHSAIFPTEKHARAMFEAAGFDVIKQDLSDRARNLFLLGRRETAA